MERQMDLMREQHGQSSACSPRSIAGKLTVERHADFLSALADIIVDLAVTMCWRKIKNRHRDDPKFAVLAYRQAERRGAGLRVRPRHGLRPRRRRRIRRALHPPRPAHPTLAIGPDPAGQLFKTDLRLRPNGDSGLMVVSLAKPSASTS